MAKVFRVWFRFIRTRILLKKIILVLFIICFCVDTNAQETETPIYLFSYFKNNGQDGLHLAYSEDGYKWQSLKKDASILTPEVGKDKLMRDPCVIKGGDGLYHMVWTVSWTDRGIGYASSKDLIHWSKQEFIPVMAHEDKARNTWAPEITYDEKSKTYKFDKGIEIWANHHQTLQTIHFQIFQEPTYTSTAKA